MDRRSFSKLAAGACGAPLALLSACGGGSTADGPQRDAQAAVGSSEGRGTATGPATNPAGGSTISPSVIKYSAKPNPSGLRWGFWEVFTQQAATLATMGRRPSSRVSFDGWAAIELTPGQYSFPNPARYGDTHAYGESILGAVNISFRIPPLPGYRNDITDPATRQAAKNFLRAYVGWLLNNFGSATLTIDYEIVSNYKLAEPGSEARGQQWAAWYLEAAAEARAAAAALGKSAQLQPIFNGDPFRPGNPIGLGGAHNPWLREVVAASDALALDTYFSDPARPVTDASYTISIIRFWIDEFAGDKPVVVTENGFTTITEQDPNITREDRNYKLTGTEAEQAAYYADLMPRLMAANLPGGVFGNRLRGFHIWSITDNPAADDIDDRYFGLVDRNGREKPAAAIVRAAIQQAEADSFHQPLRSSPVDGTNLADKLGKGKAPVSLNFQEGDRFQFLRYADLGPQNAAEIKLDIVLQSPGTLMACINGHWLIERDQAHFTPDISAHYRLGTANTIDVMLTGPSFPVTQQVQSLRVVYA